MEHQQTPNLPSSFLGVLYAYQAAVLYEQNSLERAFDLAQQAQHLTWQVGAFLFVDPAYVVLIQIFLAGKQFDAAEETLQRLLALPSYRDNDYAQTWLLSGLQVRLWLATGKQETAVQWSKRRQQHAPLPPVFAQEREAVAQELALLTKKLTEAH